MKRRGFPVFDFVLVAIAVAMAFVLPPPATVERVYSLGTYPLIDKTVRAITDHLPFALGDVLFVFAGVVLIGTLLQGVIRWKTFGYTLAAIAGAGAVAFMWFMVSWAYNYHRIPIEEKVVINASRTSDDVTALANKTIDQLNASVGAAHAEMERERDFRGVLRPTFMRVIHRLGNVAGEPPPPPKPSLFNGFMQETATYGFTNPWTHEVQLVSTLYPYERPASYAHEWSHVAGFADESEANYIAALSCINSADPLLRYSGWLLVWFNLPEDIKVTERADKRVYADIEAVRSRYKKEVKPAVARASNAVYNNYLKANSVKAGMKSYHLFVRLLAGGEFDKDGLPVLARLQPGPA
jgi:hypothetical protein